MTDPLRAPGAEAQPDPERRGVDSPKMPSCEACGSSVPDGARFCPACGAPFGAPRLPDAERQTRRVVTVLFADLVGSTGIAERLDPEAFRTVQTRFFDALRGTIERHGGTVEKFIGDAVMAVFGLPSVHEDDALRAVRAAADFEPSLESLNRDLVERHGLGIQLRVGINTGEVVTSEAAEDGALVTGDTVHVAARLQQLAAPGDVLIGPTTLRLIRDWVSAEPLESVQLRGRSGSLVAHRVVAVAPAGERPERSGTPLVGRDRELALLTAEFELVERSRVCRMVPILAAAGVGKSRLVREFQSHLGDRATVLRSRCLPYGDGITFWPLAQIIRQASGLTDDTAPIDARTRLDATLDGAPRGVEVAATLASLLGLERAAGAAEDMGWAIRLFLAHLARERPLIVVVEDIHWAEPGLLDVLEATVDWTRDAPILILCPTRLDLLDARPALFVGRDNVTALRLLPLAADDTGVLIDVLPGGSALPAALRHRIEEVSEGNPLYVEEMLGMLVDDGRLRRDGEGWAAAPELGTLTVPVSVQALIAARIDALAFAERRVAERASVVGREFERSAVAALTPAEERKALSGLLLSLTRKELIGTAEPGLSRDDVFRFRHILIRDAAYERLPKRDRADLHARLADWLEGISGDGRGDLLEILSYHLAEAIRFRAEIGMDRDEELIERALTALSETAARADRSHRYADVAELLLRKVAVLEQAGGGSATIDSALEVRLRAAEAAHLGGHSDLAISVIGEVISQVDAMGNPSRSGSAHERLGTYLVEAERTAEALAAYERSLELLIEPSLLRARALASLGRLHMLIDRYDDAQRVLEEALQIPSTAGMDSIRASAMTSLGTVLNESGAWQEGINWIRRGLEQARAADDGFEIVRAYNNLGGALERAGEIAASVAIFEEGHAEIVRRRLTHVAPRLLANWSFNLLLMGRVNEAEVRARQALELGPSDDFVLNIWDRLGAALLFAGRLDEADEAYVRAGSSADRAWAIGRQLSAFELRMGFGRILAAKGEFDAADATFREAVPHDLGGFPLAELPDLVAEAAGNRANQATRLRRAGDVAHASDVAASAEGWRQEFVRLWPTNVEPSPRLRPALAIIDAEVERAWGRPDPVAWTRVVAAARSVGMRLAEAYAQFRFTEALAETGRPIAEITDALLAALTLSRELGTGLYTSQIEALADRLRLRVPTFAEPTS